MSIPAHLGESKACGDQFKGILFELSKFERVKRELNVFSIGARSYYERPMSDLLGFFLDPSAGHELGDVVLSSLWDCLSAQPSFPLKLEEPPLREYKTTSGKRMDIVLNGSSWVVAIETKLLHTLDNPFDEYRESIEGNAKFKGKQKYYVILAPYYANQPLWTWVDLRKLTSNVYRQLGRCFGAHGVSKWHVLLREFLLNVDDQVGAQVSDEEFQFVLRNYRAVVNAVRCREQFIETLKFRVREAAAKGLGSDPSTIAREDWGDDEVALRVYRAKDREHNATLLIRVDGTFIIYVYVEKNQLDAEVGKADFELDGMFKPVEEERKGEIWVFRRNEDELENAMNSLKAALTALRHKAR